MQRSSLSRAQQPSLILSPARLADRAWTSWLLIVPIGGLVVLFYSLLQPWFLR